MKDFRGNDKLVMYLGVVTGKQFEQKYNELSKSEDKLPVASNLIPILVDSDEAHSIFHAWIFYETVQKKEVKLEL